MSANVIPITATPRASLPYCDAEPYRHRSPELDLVKTILWDAVELAAEDGDAASEARDWISDDSDEPWSFEWCCELLRLPSSSIRSRVLAGGKPAYLLPVVETPDVLYSTRGCAICSWCLPAGESVCTDANGGNPCCVRRNPTGALPSGATGDLFSSVLPCMRCAARKPTRYVKRKAFGTKSGSVRLCAECARETKMPPTIRIPRRVVPDGHFLCRRCRTIHAGSKRSYCDSCRSAMVGRTRGRSWHTLVRV